MGRFPDNHKNLRAAMGSSHVSAPPLGTLNSQAGRRSCRRSSRQAAFFNPHHIHEGRRLEIASIDRDLARVHAAFVQIVATAKPVDRRLAEIQTRNDRHSGSNDPSRVCLGIICVFLSDAAFRTLTDTEGNLARGPVSQRPAVRCGSGRTPRSRMIEKLAALETNKAP